MPRPIRAAYQIPWGGRFGAGRANGTRKHQATDYHAPIGTPIYGTADGGVVVHIGYNGDPWLGLGHNVTIAYGGYVSTIDGHMDDRTKLRVGDPVGPTTLIGYVGQTGNAVNASPPGPHDHHVRMVRGVPIDPESVYGTETASTGSAPIIQKRKKTTMYLSWDTSGTGYLTTDSGTTPVANPIAYNLLYRLINSDQLATPFGDASRPFIPAAKQGHPHLFTKAEQGVIAAHLRLIQVSVSSAVEIDHGKMVAALKDALGGADPTRVTVDQLNAALETAVPRIAAAVRARIIKE